MPILDHADTLPRLEHIAVWAEDIDKTAAFLEKTLGWRRHPLDFGVDEDSTVFGGMRLAFIDANGFWIELVQPTTEGPGLDFLRQKGNGSIVELDFEVNDFDRTVAQLGSHGVVAIGMDGEPLKDGGLLSEWAIIDGKKVRGDERLAYLPFDLSHGTSIELFWEYPNGVVLYRDATWNDSVRTPADRPRLDHVVVLAADLDAVANIYTETLGLERLAQSDGLRRDWMGVGNDSHAWIRSNGNIWIEIVAPKGAAGDAVMKDSRFGDGALMELVVDIDDIEAFHDRMQAQGITMTAGDATPLPKGSKAVVVETSGDRYCYFPLEKSEGMRIKVVQRGPQATSVLHRRDRQKPG